MIPAYRFTHGSPRRGSSRPLPRLAARLRALAVAAALPLSATACGTPPSESGAAGQEPGATIRDSAGIEIVENHAPAWDSAEFWTVDPEPEFVLGGPEASGDSAHLIWDIRGAKPLSGGRIAMLAPRGDLKVLVYEPSGRLSAAFGRSGRGPGEFHNPVAIQVLPGDTIAIWEFMFGPVYYFDPSGKILKERRIDLGALMASTRTESWHPGEIPWPLPDGSFKMSVYPTDWAPPDRSGVVYRAPKGYVRIDSAYSAHSFGGWWDGLEMLSSEGGDNLYSGVPFATSAALTLGGDPLSAYVTNNDSYEVHQFSETGVLQRILRRSVDPVAVTEGDYEEWRAFAEERNPLRDWRKWDRVIGELPRRQHPIIMGMKVDSEGFLWILNRLPYRGDRSDFSVFDPEGRWLGTVHLPAPGTYWIGEDFILASRIDYDTGIQSVERYRLDRRGRR